MENKMNMPVDVICYGTREHFETRREARDKYLEAVAASEGSEQERYAKIHYSLVHGSADLVTDGSSERVEREASSQFTVADKDKIIELIESEELSINSPEIYDIGKGKLVVEDRDVIKALLKKEGWYAAQYLRKYIENDKELLLEAARGGEGDHGALAYANEQLRDDKDFVFEMLKIDASDVRHVSERLSNDVEVVQYALKHATCDYDMECIKEGIGAELLTQMVQAHFEKRQVQVFEKEMEGSKNSLAEQIAEAESVKASEDKADDKSIDKGKDNDIDR